MEGNRQTAKVEQIARMFHEIHRELAPVFGLPTQENGGKSWEELPPAHRKCLVKTAELTLIRSGLADLMRQYPAISTRIDVNEVHVSSGFPGWCEREAQRRFPEEREWER